ncbi:MAG: pyridoxine 5'-phosphate synthase [Planctomycetota bacterium]|jgi:pyridoxine 5-phosphate synthase
MTDSAAPSTPKLSVNLNKVALLRNARSGETPSVLRAAEACIAAGAHGVTVHPRPDQRHIRHTDVHELAAFLKGYPAIEFNIEGNPFEGVFMELVAAARPHQCTLVPDGPDQNTSDHGWDLSCDADRLAPVIEQLQALDARVSLFMDPAMSLNDAAGPFERAAAIGADRVELYTETYAAAHATGDHAETLARYAASGRAVLDAGLGLNAGHDLNTHNLPDFCDAVAGLQECSIGHALVADALWLGWKAAVKRYLAAMGWREE